MNQTPFVYEGELGIYLDVYDYTHCLNNSENEDFKGLGEIVVEHFWPDVEQSETLNKYHKNIKRVRLIIELIEE